MAFLGALLSGGLGYLGQQQANAQTLNAQNAAQQQAQQYAASQQQQAKSGSQQALQQALQNLGQYQQQNPAPVNTLPGIQAPGAAQGQPQQSFGGGVQGSQAPGMAMQRPQQMGQQQNLQGAMQQGRPQVQPQPQAQQFQRLQQLYPLVQQILAGQQAAQPMARSGAAQ